MAVGDRTPQQVIAERLAAHRNGMASDGRGWYRAAGEQGEFLDKALDVLHDLADAGYAVTPAGEVPQAPDLTAVPWRVGRRKGRNLYAATGDDWEAHPEIGCLDSPELAREAVEAHNAALERREAEAAREPAVAPRLRRFNCPDCGSDGDKRCNGGFTP